MNNINGPLWRWLPCKLMRRDALWAAMRGCSEVCEVDRSALIIELTRRVWRFVVIPSFSRLRDAIKSSVAFSPVLSLCRLLFPGKAAPKLLRMLAWTGEVVLLANTGRIELCLLAALDLFLRFLV